MQKHTVTNLKNADVVDVVGNSVTRARSEAGKFYVEQTFYDDMSLEQNQRIRNSKMLERAKLGLHDNEDIRGVISCPSTEQWMIFKKKHTETYKLLTSKLEAERMKGLRQVSLLKPAWVIYDRQ